MAALGVTPLPDRPLALAVSGGPDSMAMLAIAADAYPGAVIAATVDHRLRAGSADDSALVSRWCRPHGIAHATLTPSAPIMGASLQAQARSARYAVLAKWATRAGCAALATAHHRDDQAETFLMRAARGAGPGGLAGIRPRIVIADVMVVRPLLAWSRAELRARATAQALPFVDDPANVDPRHDRTHARALLAATEWLDPARIAAAATYCTEAAEALDTAADWAWERVLVGTDPLTLSLGQLPREIVRRIVRRAIMAVRTRHAITTPAFDAAAAPVEPLLDALAAGHAATHAGVLATPTGDCWRFTAAPPRRAP